MKYLAPTLAALALLIAAAATVTWWFTLRADLISDRARIERNTLDTQREIATLTNELNEHQALEQQRRDDITSATSTMRRINARIPDTADFTRMMRTISDLADQHALRIARIYHTDTTELHEGLQRLTYDVSTTGSFESTIAFINDLHSTPRLIAITRFQLSTSTPRGAAPTTIPTITLNATITTLARAAPTPPTEPNDPTPEPDQNARNPQGGPA